MTQQTLETITELHKTCYKQSSAYLQARNMPTSITFHREKEIWAVFEPIGEELHQALNTIEANLMTFFMVSALGSHRDKIRDALMNLRDLAYQTPPPTFRYLDKWGDDLRNIRFELRKSIDIVQSLIGINFEGSTTWDEIYGIIVACLDTLIALKNMCFEESGRYMRGKQLLEEAERRKDQIGDCFGVITSDLKHFKNFVSEKIASDAPFVELHVLEYRRQKVIDLVQNVAAL